MSELPILEMHTQQLRRIETDVAQIRRQLGDFSISQFSEKLGDVNGRTMVWSGVVSLIVAAAMGTVFKLSTPDPPPSLEQIISIIESRHERVNGAGVLRKEQ